MRNFPHYFQPDSKDCGPTCLRIIAAYYGKKFSLSDIRSRSGTTRGGSNLLFLKNAAESLGLEVLGAETDVETLLEAPFPCILHWNRNHYVVLYKVRKNTFFVSDPAHGKLKYSKSEFQSSWYGNAKTEKRYSNRGVVLFIEPTSEFYSKESSQDQNLGFVFLLRYVTRYKRLIYQLIFGLLATSVFQLIVPFLTQSVVDVGIKNQNINFVYLVLFAQIIFFFSKTIAELLRSWILLYLSTRVNISLISDFFIKLMRLPIAFFDSRLTGDILQRINDHGRIEKLLTSSSLNLIFSFLHFFIFGLVLLYYSKVIFTLFLVGSILYFFWIMIFLKRRSNLDYKRFSKVSQEQSKVIELINGMQEIKLHNAERVKRWSWEFLQAKLLKISVSELKLEQTQNLGSQFINEFKNLFITIISARLVIEGEITLGMMIAISYIMGQLNAPLRELVLFTYHIQDAKIALDRLSEIHNKTEENTSSSSILTRDIFKEDLILSNINFKYPGTNFNVLKNINIQFEPEKVTAIVGHSGSGKTTLLKLLMKFYEPNSGSVKIGGKDLRNINEKFWRDHIGAVLQEGFIFNDTIANNIAVGEEEINWEKLQNAGRVANIQKFVEELPLNYHSKIGTEGLGISSGQKQRILIARAVYKNPQLLLFDEATSALDAHNERVIIENLMKFYQRKTVIIIAHRLSTVKNADKILVLKNGEIIEVGNHSSLIRQKGAYFNLIENQLELV